MRLLLNIDVPNLAAAEAFYVAAFGLVAARRFGDDAVELTGADAPVYLLRKPTGTTTAGHTRDYTRHWTPIHCDIAVDDLEDALARARAAGASLEGGVREHDWGRIAQLADPFGHGWCLIQFSAAGYDAITT